MNKLVKSLQVLGRSRQGSQQNVGICIRHCSCEQAVTDVALMFLLLNQAVVEATIGWKLEGIQLCIKGFLQGQ